MFGTDRYRWLFSTATHYKKPPSQVDKPWRMGAKPTVHNPQPNQPSSGKRKRQWR